MSFSNSITKNLGTYFIAISASSLVLLAQKQEVQAQSIPLCRNVTPKFNRVCYTEHGFSARQRDEGGTRTHSFIVESYQPGYVIVDYEVIKKGGFGATSTPTGSIVSKTGSASIIDVTNREINNLSETRSKLQGEVASCYGAVCGKLKGQVENVNRQIEKLQNYNRTAVTAGGNEKIQFRYTTSVRCEKILGIQSCGGGASIHGEVRVYQRYLGNPSTIAQESRQVQQQARLALTSSNEPIRPSSRSTETAEGRHVEWKHKIGDRIESHREMREGSYLESGDGRFKMVVQGDGNLVIYQNGRSIWASNTGGKGTPGFKLAMQSDGNLVMYGGSGVLWASNTDGKGTGPYNLVMQNDGNLVIYDRSGVVWATNTCCR